MVTHFPESLAPHVTSLVAVVLPAVESIRSNIAKNALVLLREMIRGARRGGGNGRGGGAWLGRMLPLRTKLSIGQSVRRALRCLTPPAASH